ncbi:hypothetical protein BBU29805_K22 (plasmid) [Borreliella burgdorferi 29805]|nr:hypothetical protein [Borreliella burgdorferi]ACO38532.1 hypothetical protein BBU29805_K22 [Borreliella burgdorferi 29805]MDO7272894.1 hypothetical protein [Borreliella burgdorferi]
MKFFLKKSNREAKKLLEIKENNFYRFRNTAQQCVVVDVVSS